MNKIKINTDNCDCVCHTGSEEDDHCCCNNVGKKKCKCPCHEPNTFIMHFMPCCDDLGYKNR